MADRASLSSYNTSPWRRLPPGPVTSDAGAVSRSMPVRSPSRKGPFHAVTHLGVGGGGGGGGFEVGGVEGSVTGVGEGVVVGFGVLG